MATKAEKKVKRSVLMNAVLAKATIEAAEEKGVDIKAYMEDVLDTEVSGLTEDDVWGRHPWLKGPHPFLVYVFIEPSTTKDIDEYSDEWEVPKLAITRTALAHRVMVEDTEVDEPEAVS